MRNHAVDVSIATHTDYDDGLPITQIETIGDGATSHPGEAYHPFGFIGRPKDPDVDTHGTLVNGARVLFWYEGNTLHTVGLDDPRRTAKLPIVKKGGSCHYADVDDAHAVFDGDDGRYELVVPAGTKVTLRVKGGASVVIEDGAVKLGDASATPLALGSVLGTLLAALATCTPALSETGLAAVKTAMSSFTGSDGAHETKIAKGT